MTIHMLKQVLIDVEPMLTDTPTTARTIWKRLGMWAPTSVRNALEQLTAAGKAVRTSEPGPGGGPRYLYRRAA